MTGATLNRGGSRQDYETPPEFIQAVERRFGRLACDLAATDKNTKAQIWYGDDSRTGTTMDSLTVERHLQPGVLWLNPPYSDIAPWAAKCHKESQLGAKILLLTPASVGSNWFLNHVFDKARVLFLNGRLTFVGASDPYPKDCMLSCFGFEKPGFEIWRWK